MDAAGTVLRVFSWLAGWLGWLCHFILVGDIGSGAGYRIKSHIKDAEPYICCRARLCSFRLVGDIGWGLVGDFEAVYTGAVYLEYLAGGWLAG